jgi:hypothetical protein
MHYFKQVIQVTKCVIPPELPEIDLYGLNLAIHEDIEKDIQNVKSGIFSFTLRVDNKLITDYILLQNAKYQITTTAPNSRG